MRALGLIVKLITGSVALGLALVAALWQWSGSDSSLATALQHIQGYLPVGQTLEAKDVSGSVRTGGHIGMLRWTRGGLSVQADDVDIAWSLEPLLRRELHLAQLKVNTLSIDNKSPPSDNQNLSPPTDLRLPFAVDVPFVFHTVHLTGGTAFEAREIRGHYVFDSFLHRLDDGRGTISYGSYQFGGSLQALAPMALKLEAHGVIQTTLPASQQPLKVQAHAKLEGELAKADVTLNFQASLQPDLPVRKGAKLTSARAMQAEVSAQIRPWQAQPLAQGKAQWGALNLAVVWPGAPQTELVGQATVTPSGASWRGQIDASNSLPGQWDQGRLPVTSLKANVVYTQSQWLIDALDARGAGGKVTGRGSFRGGHWQGSASLSDINPAALDSRLNAAALHGAIDAAQVSAGISFSAQLSATQGPATSTQTAKSTKRQVDLGQLNLAVQGIWAAPKLKLTTLALDALDAHLHGSLDYNTMTQATWADLKVTLPGLQAALNGHLASTEGQGSLTLELADAGQTTHWLQRWPLPAALRDALPVSGTANLHADWQGGWQSQGQQFKVAAGLTAPLLTWSNPQRSNTPAPNPTQLRDATVDVSGTLAALRLSSRGTTSNGQRQLEWHAEMSGGQVNTGHWLGSVNELKLHLQSDPTAGPWTILADTANGKSISVDWLQDSAGQKISLGNGRAKLTSPLPNDPLTASLSWQSTSWTAPALGIPGAKALARWQSKGKLTGLPLAWVDVMGFKSLTELGIQSNMLLDGDWEAAQTDSLKLRAGLERSSGDLTIRTSDDHQQTQGAGVQLAQLQLQVLAGEVSGSLHWDSARAGQATVKFATSLFNQDGAWVWPANAPVSGNLKVQMPPIDAWSVLAPPGWRLRGTLDANANLSGTRTEPQWLGSLQAKDLAVRSVADGIDFQQGSLMAHLEGQRLSIDTFILRGAGKDGGQITVNGAAEWRANDKAEATALDHVDMHLEVSAQALRLSTRSDRRMTVSGKLSADLKDTRLQLRGDLTADQAVLTLPSENVPALGDDVVVRRTATQAALGKTSPSNSVKHPGALIAPEVQVTFDLGPNFQVSGRGLETRLTGKLELLASHGNPPTLTGTVNTVRGSYQAYGQRLEIEQGIVRFVGPVDNPVLDILAIRPKLTQRVGVQVIGTVLLPVVRLYAEPDLPEAEKLAWLVMGRSTNGSGGEAALLQQAAMALLGGSGQGPTHSLTQALGLDELSFRSATANADTTTGATITLGKRLSNDFYVAYESGLAGTMGVFNVFYDLSRSLTLRAKTGDQSAVDVIWTRRYD